MNLFVDKNKRRKSPMALVAFVTALGYCLLFGALYALLAEPLFYAVRLPSLFLTNAVHSLIVSVTGTAVCCLLFLLKDKRVAPYGFAGLLVVLCMFYAASTMQTAEDRSIMLPVITAYGLAPVLVGNAVTWLIYIRYKRSHPAPKAKKTIQEEFREALKKENSRRTSDAEASENKQTSEEISFDASLGSCPASDRSAENEAMLFYEEEDDD